MLPFTTHCLHCRRRTPPSSPHPAPAAAADPVPATPADAGHYLRPAGPGTDPAEPSKSSATVLFPEEDITRRSLGNSSSPVPENAAVRRLHPDQTTCTGSGAEGAGRQSTQPSCTTGASPEAADANQWWSPGKSRRAEEEQGSHAPRQRGRQVSRWGRAARGTAPRTAAAAASVPSELERLGFARLGATRYSCILTIIAAHHYCSHCAEP